MLLDFGMQPAVTRLPAAAKNRCGDSLCSVISTLFSLNTVTAEQRCVELMELINAHAYASIAHHIIIFGILISFQLSSVCLMHTAAR